jgi:L-amino acid N-acyltransferase YncA
MIIRPATAADAEAMAALYAHHVLHGVATFEETPPTAGEMASRLQAVRALGLPWLAAEEDGRILGYAYAGAYRYRSAYRYTAETSVYVAADALRRGVGRALLGQVIEDCEALGLRQMVGVIGDSANAGSVALHRSLGFELIGTLPAVGYKHGRWIDVVFMQKPLNGGSGNDPQGEGLLL